MSQTEVSGNKDIENAVSVAQKEGRKEHMTGNWREGLVVQRQKSNRMFSDSYVESVTGKWHSWITN